MDTLNQITTQTKRLTLLALTNPVAYRVKLEEYNDGTGKFEPSESYGSPYLIDCQIEFDNQTFNL